MLSDVDIDNLIQPFIDRQDEIERRIVSLIAERVKQIGTMLPSDIHKLERLYKSGSDVKAINEALAQMTGLQVQDIKRMIKYVAANAYTDAAPYYDYRHITQIPLSQNIPLMRAIQAVGLQTAKEYRNLSNSKMIGFMIRDMKNPGHLKFYNAVDTYRTVIDEAIQAVQNGAVDYGTAMRRTLKQLNSSGLQKLYWDSGYTQRMDTAVQRNILDGVRQINQQVHLITGKQIGADGVELTAHELSAPDHEPFQGHIFKNEEYEKLQSNQSFKDINGRKFAGVERVIGQWNCKHFAYPIIIGVSKPKYTEKQLQDMMDRNAKGVTLPNGKHLTGYEATQYQNKLALKVRQAKDGQMIAQKAGDMDLARQFQAKVNSYTKKYDAFNKKVGSQIGLSERRDKLRVSGYKKISVSA